jgi:6-pyruvoyltetrahydropterin/6-carboxytetrahydropterin synthase
MKIEKEFHINAAHYLPNYQGKCKQMHGHTWVLIVKCDGTPDPFSGMILDFYELDVIVKREVCSILDHSVINDTIPNPTAENVAIWIHKKLAGKIPEPFAILLSEGIDGSGVEL